MLCHEFLEFSERWMEGERDAAAAAHLKSCANCSALVADLEMIGGAAPELAELAPPERLWVSLRNQMEAEGLVKEPVEAVALPAPARSGWLFGLHPALATSFLALLVVAFGFYYRGSFSSITPGPVELRDGSEVLAELAALGLGNAPVPQIHEHNPMVTASFQKSIEVVDKAIALCEKTVREQPKNDMAREYLLSAYQQKADLLASMSQRAAMGD